jgi:beta-N-acetylhexosaminidase
MNTLPRRDELTLDQKIAQMLLVGFRGYYLDEHNPVIGDLRDLYVGGVILFDYDVVKKAHDRNISSPAQLLRLTEQLRSHMALPTFVSIDQEGGTVNRLKPDYGFKNTISHRELGEQNDLLQTEQQGRHIAAMLREYGINLNFAPCLDLAINKQNKAIYGRDRTFSENPETAAQHAAAYIRGHRAEGVLTCVKHFPGHGSSLADTHLGVADVTDSWSPAEVYPYQYLLDNGLIDMVMTTHIFNRNLDERYPATLSRAIMQGILRDTMGYDGVIISDDLQMQAIADHFGYEQVVELALLAGLDILAIGNNLAWEPDIAQRTIGIVKDLLDRGVIDEARIDRSVDRILQRKQELK